MKTKRKTKRRFKNNGERWSTNDEMRFLDNIGNFSNPPSPLPRKVLLKKYADSMEIRHNWDNIDKVIVEEYLAKETGGL